MTDNNQIANIKDFRKKKYLNIGSLIFGIIFIYLIITIIMYLTAPHITPYEVREGEILKDSSYTGLAIRDETVVYSDAGGYINYYTQNNAKVRYGTNIYALSDEAIDITENTSEEIALSEEEKNTLFLKMQTFSENYKDSSFSDTYLLKDDIETAVSSISSQSKLDQLNAALNSGSLSNMTLFSASDDGVVVYSVDGMEGLTKDTVTPEHLNKANYSKTEFTNNTKISSGEPVYKLVTDDSWMLVIELEKETAKALEGKKEVKVTFSKDNQAVWAGFETKEVDGKTLAYLTFSDSMIRYANERYLDIQLVLEDESGLKIPKSAVTEKSFYVVPKSYITQGGNSNESGVLRRTVDKSGKEITEFLSTDIYYENEDIVYLDPNAFEKGDVLVKPESSETYDLKKQETLKGVFNINKGYAVFKQIHILCESEEYYIVEEGNSYGLTNYDRIALDSSGIKENDVVY